MQLDLLHNFGGNGPVIHLAHANGFPPGAYRLLAETLISDYRVIALPSRPILPGSHPTSAPTWHPLAEDLIEGLDGLGLGGIVGVGHSLGGVLTMWAAIRRPDLFRAVILIEPVILPPSWLRMLRIMRALGLQQRQPLVQGAQRRRRTWPNRQVCFEQYRSKAFFAHWPDEALWDYVHYGTRAGGDDAHVELVYPPEWEAHIFATTPLDIWHAVPELHTRALIIRGEHSTTFQPAAEARMARLLPQARFATIAETGHFLPMERTAVLGRAIKEFLLEITPGRGPGWSGGQAGVAV